MKTEGLPTNPAYQGWDALEKELMESKWGKEGKPKEGHPVTGRHTPSKDPEPNKSPTGHIEPGDINLNNEIRRRG